MPEVPPVPHDLDAERAALGAAMLNPAAADAVLRGTRPTNFFDPRHGDIHRALCRLHDRGDAIDLLTLRAELEAAGKLESIGGDGYLADLLSSCPSPSNVAHYLRLVLDAAERREVMGWADEVKSAAAEGADGWRTLSAAPPEARGEVIERRDPIALYQTQKDDGRCLLGNDYLRKGQEMLIFAPTGVGKSSLLAQMHVLHGLGAPAFGIHPKRPLRILCVQAENDDGDMGEIMRGVIDGLHITDPEQLATIRENVRYIRHRSSFGVQFCKRFLAPEVAAFGPDIVCIDPLNRYFGGDMKDEESLAEFLYTGLTPICDRYDCALQAPHHTPKTTNRDTSAWKAHEWNYAGSGSARLSDWARAIITIDATSDWRVFRWMAGKRWDRLGWADSDGKPSRESFWAWGDGKICWEPCDADRAERAMDRIGQGAAKGQKAKRFTMKWFLECFPAGCGNPAAALKKVSAVYAVGRTTYYDLWHRAIEDREIINDKGVFVRTKNVILEDEDE